MGASFMSVVMRLVFLGCIVLGLGVLVLGGIWLGRRFAHRSSRPGPLERWQHDDHRTLANVQEHVKATLPLVPGFWDNLRLEIQELAFTKLPALYAERHDLLKQMIESTQPRAFTHPEDVLGQRLARADGTNRDQLERRFVENFRRIEICQIFLRNLDSHIQVALRQGDPEAIVVNLMAIEEHLKGGQPAIRAILPALEKT
jgi:hypothetical protein